MVGALVVIGLALAATYYASRWYAKRAGVSASGKYVKIVDKLGLAQGSSVYIIKVNGRYHMLGVSDRSVSYLSELPEFTETGDQGGNNALPFSQVIKGAMGKRGDGD